jgi:pyruvate formate lyase activating enzyme
MACPAEAREQVGRLLSVDEVLERVEQDRLYYEQSGGGVTFSGGEPLFQWQFLLELLKACGERDLHRTVDTTGYAQTRVLLDVARETDLFLYDLKVMDPELHQEVTGVPLEPIIENLKRLLETGARVRIRIPMIPGITSDESIRRTADLLVTLPSVEGVHLLPFHKSARDKHEKFGVPWRLDTTEIPAGAEERWAALLRDRGLAVTIGG